MGAVIWGVNLLLLPVFGMPGLRWIARVFMMLAGIVSYFGIGHLIGAFRLSEFRQALRR
jgi:putative peptidoglycan lipid II flippase